MSKNKYLNWFIKNLPIIISVIFWFLLSIFLTNFVNKLFASSQEDVIDREKILIISLILLSITLLVVIIIFLIRVVISAVKKEFGARMRLKITLFFIFVSLLPIIPFIQIGTKFIESSMTVWFSKNFGVALDLSEEIIRAYYNEKKDILDGYAVEINNVVTKRNYDLKRLTGFIPQYMNENKINNITIWSEKGEMIKQFGENIYDVEVKTKELTDNINGKITLVTEKEGIFNVQKKDGKLFLIIPSVIMNGSKNIGFCNIAISIQPQFNKVTEEIDNALRNYNTVSLYKDFFTKGFSILFIAIISPIILIILIISLFITKDLLDPIQNLAMATRRVAGGDLKFQVDSAFNDEFMVLSKSFNSMITELELSHEKLQQKEKIATWQEMAKQLAHEIRNPLTPIRLSSERLLKKYYEDQEDFENVLKKGIKTIITEVENMDKLLNEFSYFARLPEIHKEKGGVIEILNDSIDLVSISENNIEFDVKSELEDYIILRDDMLLKSVFVNILKNGVDAMLVGGTIHINLMLKDIGFKKYLEISFQDQGLGFEEEDQEDVFSPYFSTKENGRRIGLAIAQRIVNEHEGRIYYVSSNDHGVTFFIEIPIAEEQS
jgi:two-component system, NtrC family, nitrogen regulation sensor histidine kinase NtrY